MANISSIDDLNEFMEIVVVFYFIIVVRQYLLLILVLTGILNLRVDVILYWEYILGCGKSIALITSTSITNNEFKSFIGT